MSEITLSAINVYPVISLKGIQLSDAFVDNAGLAFDRRFMLSDPEGNLLSARQAPQLLQFQTLLRDDGIEIIAPDGEHLSLRYPELFQNYKQVTVWGSEINAQHCGAWFDEWISEKLGRPAQLLYFGEQSERFTSRKPDSPVAFADGYPLLIISQASLDDLNSRASRPSSMQQFRTNLVVDNTTAFAEDSWKKIRIGEVEFEVVKPCSRCVMTTYDPSSSEPIGSGEPIKTLAAYRKGEDNEVYFGQNLVPLNQGKISAGDKLEVLETQTADTYPNNAPVINSKEYSQTQNWPAEKRLTLRCQARTQETPDVVTFRFALPDGYKAEYQAGQFMTLFPSINNREVARCYTLSSSPSRPSDISITVKRVTDGEVSNWLHDNLQPGDHIDACGPQGEFHEHSSDHSSLLLLSAGSGITPMLSIARHLTDQHSPRDIVFYHQARTESDLICEDELFWLARQNPRLKLIFSLSQPDPNWPGIKGRISREQLITLIPDLPSRAVLCCGPEGFMQQAKDYCRQLGLPQQRWYEESFGAPPGVDQTAPAKTVKISFNKTEIEGNNQETLLKQAEDAGIQISSGCRAGVCGACRVTLLSGEVHRSSEIPLSEDEKQQGVILACSCNAETDVEIGI